MSIRIMSDIWETSFPPTDKLVFLALADCANDEGLAWPSIATIARKSGVSERTVQRSIRLAEKAGLIRREEVKGKGCKYWFNPRHSVTPDKVAPVTNEALTPDTVSPKPSRTIIKKNIPPHEIPDDWEPQPFGAGTTSKKIVDGWPPGELEFQADKFRSNHGSKNNRFADWQKAWSTWVLNSREFRNGNSGRTGNNPNGNGRTVDGFAKALRHVADGPIDEPFGFDARRM